MTEVVDKKVEETKVEVIQHVDSPIEEQARAQNWVSKDEWIESGRDENEWRPAKEFVDRGELYKSLHGTKRELRQAQAALTTLQRHHQYVFEKAHKQALQDLKKERRAALADEDLNRVEEIEEELDNLDKEHKTELVQLQSVKQQIENTNIVNPEFQVWVNKNTWYVQDDDLRDHADAVGLVYMNRNPGTTAQNVLQHIDNEMKKKFPEKFGKRAAPNAVASVDRTGKKGPVKDSDIELTELEREMMHTLVKSGILTEQQYKAELKKVKV